MKRGIPIKLIRVEELHLSDFSKAIYGDPHQEITGLDESIRAQGILVPLVITPKNDSASWEVVSGNRRLVCAKQLSLTHVPCEVKEFTSISEKQQAVLEYNRQRRKFFSQLMREADLLEQFESQKASLRRSANLIQNTNLPNRRNSDDRKGRTDELISQLIGLGGKDLYRQARAIWQAAQLGDLRAQSSVGLIDQEQKTIFSAYKDLRRRDRFTVNFRPTPYDVWSFRHDRAFGIPHPGSIPPAIIAHTLYYFSNPGDLIVDPMAGGGTTLDVCTSMGRRCLAYDLDPQRPDIGKLDIRTGFSPDAQGCNLIFLDPPYHTMLAQHYSSEGIASASFLDWISFLESVAMSAFETLTPGGHIALLLANQTEKDLPKGYGYLDHAFYGYQAILKAGFLPQRRISCPMAGSYLPQNVRRAREEGRLLGQVRDLLVARKGLT